MSDYDETRFRIGDRVRVISKHYEKVYAGEATIIENLTFPNKRAVLFDNNIGNPNGVHSWPAGSLQLVKASEEAEAEIEEATRKWENFFQC